MTPTFTISLDGNVVMQIAQGKFNEKWSKDGDSLTGPGWGDSWRIDPIFCVITKDGAVPDSRTGNPRTHGWRIEKDRIAKQKGKGHHVSEVTEEQFELKD